MAYNVFHDLPSPPTGSEVVRFKTIWEDLDYQEWTGGPVEIKVEILKDAHKGHYYLHRNAVFNRNPDIDFAGFHYINDIVGIPRRLGEQLENAGKRGETVVHKEIQLPEMNLLFMVGAKVEKVIQQLGEANHLLIETLRSDLTELKDVLRIKAFRSVMALCGRSLEVTLKIGLELRDIQYNDDWMVGNLLRKYQEESIYLDTTLKNQLNILNSYRVMGVHIKSEHKIPSEEQILSLVLMLCDCLHRSLQLNSEEPHDD